MDKLDTHDFMIEDDMRSRKYNDTAKISEKIFKTYPILGDFSPKQQTLNKWEKVKSQNIKETEINR